MEQAQRLAEQARARERAARETQERQKEAELVRQHEQQARHAIKQVQQQAMELSKQLQRERDRMQQLREIEERRRAQRSTSFVTAQARIGRRPEAKYEPAKPPPVYYTSYGSTACIAYCDNPQIRRGYTSDVEAFERVFGPRLESAKKEEILRGILGLVYGNLIGYGIAKAPFMTREMILSGAVPPTFVRGLTYKQELGRVGNEYHLLIDMTVRTGKGGAGVLEFPKEFQRLANTLGRPVRAGFGVDVERGSTMETLINKVGHTTREQLSIGTTLPGAYTKVYYPKPK